MGGRKSTASPLYCLRFCCNGREGEVFVANSVSHLNRRTTALQRFKPLTL